MSDLDKDFEAVAEQINAKLVEAAKLLQEANKLGQDAGMEYLAGSYYLRDDLSREQCEMMDEIDYNPVLRALDNAGWSVSSMKC
jgi:hypothetical protein